ncbi:MAG: ABC transporter substrate-binding protein [Oscillospiraceae bacterium]|jgi:ABC-type nitrate/sulfonate/bicarbonate transport system substrate-binding protein|nr:ABC transporter substrate-binding protein [Oscillospiraceae bacterium]
MKKTSVYAVILTIVLLLGITSCGTEGEKADSGSSTEKITFVLDWTPNTNHTGLYVAEAKGYFAQAGLEVSIVQPPESGAPALVAAGKADFGIDAQDMLAAAWSSDEPLPVTAVAAVVSHNTSGIIAPASANIRSFKDLEGKRYASWDLPAELAVIRQVMENQGGDFDKLIRIPNTVTDVLAAIQTDIDAVWIYEGWDGVAAQVAGVPYTYLSFAEAEPKLDCYTPVVIANNAYLAEHPETAKMFLQAVGKGYTYAAENPQESAAILLEAAPELGKELVEASQVYMSKAYIADAPYWGYIDESRWNAFFDWMYDNQLIDKELGAEYFSNAYLG